MNIKKQLVLLTIGLITLSSLANAKSIFATTDKEVGVKITGQIAQFDPETTDPTLPGTPEHGEAWVKITMPTSIAYWSTGSSQHRTIISNEHSITNKSNYPVKVELSDYTKDGTVAPETRGIKTLTLHGLDTPIPLVINGKPEQFDNNKKAAKLFELGAGGKKPAPGGLDTSNIGKFSFSGETDHSTINLSQYTRLDNRLQFTFTPLSGDGNNVPKPNIPSFDPNDEGQIDFMNQKWSVIKDMGNRNYMISLQKSIGISHFNNAKTDNDPYFEKNIDSLDGYQSTLTGPSKPKLMIDQWYNKNIAGTKFEQMVVPVTLNNATLGDMKAAGVLKDNQTNGTYTNWKTINHPDAFPTTVGGNKQAFLMSASDVSRRDGEPGKLSHEALTHLKRLNAVGVGQATFRSPGSYAFCSAVFNSAYTHIATQSLIYQTHIVPTLVVHIP